MAKKLQRLKLAIKFITRQQDNQELYYRGSKVIDLLNEWCHGLVRDIGVRQQHALTMREKLHQIAEVLNHEMLSITTKLSLWH